MDSSFYARDNYSDVRKAAADALEKIDPQWRQSEAAQSTIPHLVIALVNSDNYVRKIAVEVLGKIGPTAIPHLVKALVNSGSDVRKAAADALEKIDPQWRQSKAAQSTIPHLVKALVNSDNYVRKIAVEVLGKIGPAAVKAVPYLVNALGNRKICETAAEALGKIGPAAIKAVPHLVKALVNNNDYPDTCGAIKESLDKIDPTGEWRKQQYS